MRARKATLTAHTDTQTSSLTELECHYLATVTVTVAANFIVNVTRTTKRVLHFDLELIRDRRFQNLGSSGLHRPLHCYIEDFHD